MADIQFYNTDRLDSYDDLRRSVSRVLIDGQASIEVLRVEIYWKTGKLIGQYLSQGNDPGRTLLRLSEDLHLERSIFYRLLGFAQAYPEGVATWRLLTWSHFKVLMGISDPSLRQSLAEKANQQGWSINRLQLESARRKRGKEKEPHEKGLLIEPVRCIAGIRQVGWLTGLGRAQKKVVDLGFETYQDLDPFLAAALEIGDTVAWEGQEKIWKKQGAKGDLYFYETEVEQVVDGDTLMIHLDLGFGMTRRQYIRLRGLDAAPLSEARGQKARDFLLSCFEQSPRILIRTRRRDPYGRYVGDIWAGTTYVNNALLREGLAELMA